MRALAHLCAMLLALPQILLATAFLLLYHVTGGRSVGSFFLRVLDVLYAIFTWGGLIALAVFVTLAVCAFFDRARPLAALAVALFVIASGIALVLSVPFTWSDTWLLVPGAVSLALCSLIVRRPPLLNLPA